MGGGLERGKGWDFPLHSKFPPLPPQNSQSVIQQVDVLFVIVTSAYSLMNQTLKGVLKDRGWTSCTKL